MPITWKVLARDAAYHNVKDGEVTHEGLVCRTYRKEIRPMSDCYATGRFAEVWDIEAGRPKTISCGSDFDLESKWGTAIVDIHEGPYAAAYTNFLDAEERERKLADIERAKQRAEREFHEPRKGKIMQVVRGRKVKPGTIGRVFWVGADRFDNDKTRVGLALDDARTARGGYKNVVWVDGSYLVNLDAAGPDYSNVPAL
jgi:hypothetical protein